MYMAIYCSFFMLCDASETWQLGFQDPATSIMESMLSFHNYLMCFLLAIGFFVTWMLLFSVTFFNAKSSAVPAKFTHSSTLEVVWTILPAFILIIIALPSFALLYSLDEAIDPTISLKVIGHQWYWAYEYSDYSNLSQGRQSIIFDSYMQPLDNLQSGEFRFLEVDNRVYLPVETHIRLLITSADVLHSWCVPSFGIKTDACPGRLSQASIFIKREGVFYGQCSEICGVNHGFMPIVVESLTMNSYISWLSSMIEPLPDVITQKPQMYFFHTSKDKRLLDCRNFIYTLLLQLLTGWKSNLMVKC